MDIQVDPPRQGAGPGKPLVRRIRPAGWLVLVVLALVAVVLVAAACQAILGQTREVVDEGTPIEGSPPPARTPAPTPTPGPTDTPEGWVLIDDPDLGQYLAPPPEVEAEIRAAFEAVVGCEHFTTDDSENALRDYDREAALAAYGAASAVEGRRCSSVVQLIPPESWGPKGLVWCTSHTQCKLARPKLGEASGMMLFSDENCQRFLGTDAPCLVLPPVYTGDNNPQVFFFATLELHEDDQWKVTEYEIKIGTGYLPSP